MQPFQVVSPFAKGLLTIHLEQYCSSVNTPGIVKTTQGTDPLECHIFVPKALYKTMPRGSPRSTCSASMASYMQPSMESDLSHSLPLALCSHVLLPSSRDSFLGGSADFKTLKFYSWLFQWLTVTPRTRSSASLTLHPHLQSRDDNTSLALSGALKS